LLELTNGNEANRLLAEIPRLLKNWKLLSKAVDFAGGVMPRDSRAWDDVSFWRRDET